MAQSIPATVANSLSLDHSEAFRRFELDVNDVHDELEQIADDAQRAELDGVHFVDALYDRSYPYLRAFHQGLRDALLMELPTELHHWIASAKDRQCDVRNAEPINSLHSNLLSGAIDPQFNGDHLDPHRQVKLAQILLFETVRLHLLVAMWSSEDFERVGGSETSLDRIAWNELQYILNRPSFVQPGVRPFAVLLAAANVSLVHDAENRAEALRKVGEDERELLQMRARLRSALRELRLPESVLLENAFSNLLGEERQELSELKADRPLALDGMSRQAMDQRVSRGRKALSQTREQWPARRRPALFDLLRH